ncbi:hypothetical protein DYU11_08785 [Fibrisoma montanum]|uniref:Uncharacterized protein n=1 Tax=Fibrisoma montanum TaxID=2305895 RepID=A0A418MF52_9BACT|nr:hypothetical protein [Fibrisoma montanum]RIV25385.1 hypothetical protein DYU11_08785 [Fibrisoma montanum]
MYFEDIFHPIKTLWKEQYYLEYGNSKKSFIISLRDDFREIEYIVEVERREQYNEWHRMMVLVSYQVLTKIGLTYLELAVNVLNIKDIPVEVFEKKYRENLEHEGNEGYLSKYKGRKS